MSVAAFSISLYECRTCRHNPAPLSAFMDDGDGECCSLCGAPVRYVDDVPARYVTCALYETSRAYGGPEEGGWYYTTGTVMPETIRAFEAGDFPQADLYMRQLWDRARAENEGLRHSETRFEARFECDAPAPASFPARRPHYC